MNWKKILLTYNKVDSYEQRKHQSEIEEAFEEMLKTNPTRKEFVLYTDGLVLFPSMLYSLIYLIK
jgi:hypothetical protein